MVSKDHRGGLREREGPVCKSWVPSWWSCFRRLRTCDPAGGGMSLGQTLRAKAFSQLCALSSRLEPSASALRTTLTAGCPVSCCDGWWTHLSGAVAISSPFSKLLWPWCFRTKQQQQQNKNKNKNKTKQNNRKGTNRAAYCYSTMAGSTTATASHCLPLITLIFAERPVCVEIFTL